MEERKMNKSMLGKKNRWFIALGLAGVLLLIVMIAKWISSPPRENITGIYYYNSEDYRHDLRYYTKEDLLEINLILYITEENELLLEQRTGMPNDPVEWIFVGTLEEIQLTQENFNDYFYYNGGYQWSSWVSDDNNPLTPSGHASYYLKNNWKAWRTIADSRMIYLLQQKNGEIYLAYGYYDVEGMTDPYSDDSEFYFLKRVAERTPEELIQWGVILVEEYGMDNIASWNPEEEIR